MKSAVVLGSRTNTDCLAAALSCPQQLFQSVDTVFATVVATTVATLKDKSKVWGDF